MTSSKPRIRQATLLDLPAMAAMKDAAWRESYVGLVPDAALAELDARRPAVVAHWEELLHDGAYFWVATSGDDVVGVSLAAPGAPGAPNPLELVLLYVLDAVKGTGLAAALLRTAIGDADAHLWVVEGNDRAIAFYRRHGFELDGGTKQTRIPGVRAVRLVRRVPDEA